MKPEPIDHAPIAPYDCVGVACPASTFSREKAEREGRRLIQRQLEDNPRWRRIGPVTVRREGAWWVVDQPIDRLVAPEGLDKLDDPTLLATVHDAHAGCPDAGCGPHCPARIADTMHVIRHGKFMGSWCKCGRTFGANREAAEAHGKGQTCGEPTMTTDHGFTLDWSVPRFCNQPAGHDGSHIYTRLQEETP